MEVVTVLERHLLRALAHRPVCITPRQPVIFRAPIQRVAWSNGPRTRERCTTYNSVTDMPTWVIMVAAAAAVCLRIGAEAGTPMPCFTAGAPLPLSLPARFARAPSPRNRCPATGLRMQLERRQGGFDLVSGKDFDLLALRCAIIGMRAGDRRQKR